MTKIILRKTSSQPLTPEDLGLLIGDENISIDAQSENFPIVDRNYLANSYIQRIQAATRAFNIACESMLDAGRMDDNTKIKLHRYMETVTTNHIKLTEIRDTLSEYQEIYENHLHRLQLTLSSYCAPLSAIELLSKADQYMVMQDQKPILATLSPHTYPDPKTKQPIDGFVMQMEIPLPPLNTEMATEYFNAYFSPQKKPPLWYKGMSEEEKILFSSSMKMVLEGVDKTSKEACINAIQQNINAISSRLRTIPGPANLSKHRFLILDNQGKIVYQSVPRLRSSMVASRDIEKSKTLSKEDKQDLRLKFTVDNIKEIIRKFIEDQLNNPDTRQKYLNDDGEINTDFLEDIPILLKTLISPVIQPDKALYADKLRAIEKIRSEGISLTITVNNEPTTLQFTPNLFEVNHPMNAAASIIPSGSWLESGETQQEALRLVKHALASTQDDVPIRKAALDLQDLINNVHTDFKSIFTANERELHLAALEEFIVSRLGGLSYGSCVSGKDRKGLETLYVDAMELYHFKYGELPKFNDTPKNREAFIDIFAELYITNHQQLNAGQNAPGANGVKTPAKYLPDDILNKIIEKSGNPNILDESERLASNNDIDKILKKGSKLTSTIKSQIKMDIDKHNHHFKDKQEATLTKHEINVMLRAVLNSDLMKSQGKKIALSGFTNKAPDGVRDMLKYLSKNPNTSFDSMMWKLAAIAKERINNKDPNRSAVIKNLYNIVIGIQRDPSDPYWINRLRTLDKKQQGDTNQLGRGHSTGEATSPIEKTPPPRPSHSAGESPSPRSYPVSTSTTTTTSTTTSTTNNSNTPTSTANRKPRR